MHDARPEAVIERFSELLAEGVRAKLAARPGFRQLRTGAGGLRSRARRIDGRTRQSSRPVRPNRLTPAWARR